jgi:hypothetical protein
VVVSEGLEDVVEVPTAAGVGRPRGVSTELLGQRVDVNELLGESASGVEHINLERFEVRELAEAFPASLRTSPRRQLPAHLGTLTRGSACRLE